VTTTRLSTSAFAALVVATIGAFFVTQHLKVTTPLIQGYPAFVPGTINPAHGVKCGKYNSGSSTISFYLQHRSDTVIVSVVSDQTGLVVDTLASGRHMRKGIRHPDGVFHWNGRESSGQVAPDGTYYLRVGLIHQGRTIDLTGSPVKIKTVPPRPVITSVTPTSIPTASGSTRVTIRYRGNESRGGTILIYRMQSSGGEQLVKTFLTPWKGQSAVWDGTLRGQQPAPPGTYRLALQVTDAACNTGTSPGSTVTVS
jgi:hypothetical protein